MDDNQLIEEAIAKELDALTDGVLLDEISDSESTTVSEENVTDLQQVKLGLFCTK